MFKQSNRLTKKKDLERVFQQGQAHYTSLLGIKTLSNNLNKNRITVIVNLKVSKKAVARNKVKRQVRQALKEFSIKSGYDIIVICLPPIIENGYKEIESAVKQALSKLKLI
ncbi:MAG: ribonuclease P protein component [bacterium]